MFKKGLLTLPPACQELGEVWVLSINVLVLRLHLVRAQLGESFLPLNTFEHLCQALAVGPK